MTLAPSQLDELERKATGFTATSEFGVEPTELDAQDRQAIAHLVAVYRAALALDEACDRGADVSVMAERLRAVRLALVGKDAP